MPREKTMKVVFAFPTTTMAMKMEAAAKAKEAPGRLIPVPRQISAGCGWPGAHRLRTEFLWSS
ncbi:MAG: putative Se/S carrier-like protein [Clostridium sp.]